MMQIAIISGTFHLLAVIFLAVLLWERNWWRNEAEALQLVHHRTKERLQAMIQDVEDAREDVTLWEFKAAELWGEQRGASQ